MKKLITGLLLTISFNSFSQQSIFATTSGGDLYSFDLANCTRQFIGSTGQGFGDIAFTPDGKLWGIVGEQLYQIDTTTANAVLIGNTGVGAVSLVGLNDYTLLAEYGMKLYGIDITTGSSYYIDTIGYQAAGDLTWYDDDLYIVTSGGQIIRMVLNSSYTAILTVAPIGLSVPTCEGAVTGSFIDDFNSIIGFNGPDLLKICQIDGSFQILCPNLNIGGTPGAASIRLSTQVPQPITCSKTTGLENVYTNNLFSIFPNPVANELNIMTNYFQHFNFTIYNSVGQIISKGKTDSNATIITIYNLANGIYSIELSSDNKAERHSFIVEK